MIAFRKAKAVRHLCEKALELLPRCASHLFIHTFLFLEFGRYKAEGIVTIQRSSLSYVDPGLSTSGFTVNDGLWR
jgi:hypothetical protein